MDRADVKRVRQELGLTQNQLARLIGVSDSVTVRRWESGARIVGGTTETLLKLLNEHPELCATCEQLAAHRERQIK